MESLFKTDSHKYRILEVYIRDDESYMVQPSIHLADTGFWNLYSTQKWRYNTGKYYEINLKRFSNLVSSLKRELYLEYVQYRRYEFDIFQLGLFGIIPKSVMEIIQRKLFQFDLYYIIQFKNTYDICISDEYLLDDI